MPNWNLPSFKLQMNHWSKNVIPATIVAVQKKLALELFSKIIVRTPVDKGFLRGAWTISIQQPDTSRAGKDQYKGKTGEDLSGEEKAAMDSMLESISNLELGQIIWLANAMPYVARIEFESWSKQAPSGMVNISLAELQAGIIDIERALSK